MRNSEETMVSSPPDSVVMTEIPRDILKLFYDYLNEYTSLGERTKRKYVITIKKLLRRRKSLMFSDIIKFLVKRHQKFYRSAVIHFLKFLNKEELVNKLPRMKIKEPSERQIPTIDEIKKVIDSLKGENQMIAKFLLYTGCRCHEAFLVKAKDIDWQSGFVMLTTKGGKPRSVLLPDKFLKELYNFVINEKGLLADEYIFKTHSTGRIESKVKKFYEYLNEKAIKIIGKKIGTHDFRRVYAVYVYRHAGKDPLLLQKLLRHKDIKTTMKYIQYAINQEDLTKTKKILNEIID